MKSTVLLILGLTVSLAARATDMPVPHVTVFGTAVTEAKPDLLRWHLTISNIGPDIGAVAKKHSENVAIVLRTLAQEGIPAEDMQTAAMQLAEHREYQANSWVKDGYVASTAVSFTLKELSRYGQLWLHLAELGGVSVDVAAWDVSNRIALQNSTRLDALKNAKAKAEQMATALGARIGERWSIDEIEIDASWGSPRLMTNSVMAAQPQDGDGASAIAPGTIPIRIRVQVAFRISGS